jgi:glycosyltransferase involved in cell wall biosynthesis
MHYNLTLAALARAALKRLDFIVDSFEEHTSALRRLNLLHKREFVGFPGDSTSARRRIRPELRQELIERYGKAHRVFMWFSRLNFSDPNSLIYKGAERFLKALECVLPEIERGEVRVVMGRHGNELDKFLALVADSPLKDNIEWVPHLGAHELSTYLSLPNGVLFAECSEHLRELSGIGRDAAASGTVTVSSAIPEIVERQYGRKAPMLRAVLTHEVEARMREIAEMRDGDFTALQREMSDFGNQAIDYKAFIPRYYGFVQRAIARAQHA